MLSILAFVSLSAFAAGPGTSNYTYQAQVIAGQESCATEAKNWSLRFAAATGAKVKAATCRSEQSASYDKKNYTVYNLGLSYEGQFPYQPYTVLVGKKDVLAPSRLNDQPIYPSLDNCLADVATQTAYYEQFTGLKVVTATCVADAPFLTITQYFVKIEGFDDNKKFYRSQPKQSLHIFAPSSFEKLRDDRQVMVRQLLISYGATIVQQSEGTFVYYRADGPAPLNSETLGTFRNVAECPLQIESAQEIYAKAGSKNAIVWCTDSGQLQTVFEGYHFLNRMYFANQTQYSSIEQCLADKEFVLSDVRNAGAIGAICAPSIYDSAAYSMTLFRKGY